MSRNARSARRSGAFVSCKNCSDDLASIPTASDLVIIAVPDQSIHAVAESLAALPNLEFSRLSVCHTSGALTSDVLSPLARKGAHVFSLHPIQTFPARKPLKDQLHSMKGITYGIEGPGKSIATAKTLVRQLGGENLFVPKDAKILYHLACVVASNYSVALVGALESITGEFTHKKLQPFKLLLQTSLENAVKMGAGKALTGPIVRGDTEIVSRHLKSIKTPELRAVYKSLGAYALELAVGQHKLAPEQVTRFRRLLGEKEEESL